MTYGITIKQPVIPTPDAGDTFAPPRPSFPATNNAAAIEAMDHTPKDTSPSFSVVERVAFQGNTSLAELLANAQQAAKDNAVILERAKKPRVGKKNVAEATEEAIIHQRRVAAPLYTSEDVIDSDADFIRRTRNLNLQSPEAKALFHANGGDKFLQAGLTYAGAWDAMRRERQAKLRPITGQAKPYQRQTQVPTGSKSVVPGMPTHQDYVRRHEAEVKAQRVASNEKWAGILPK